MTSPDSPPLAMPRAPAPKPRHPLLRGLAIAICVALGVAGAATLVVSLLVASYLSDAPQMPSRAALWSIRRSPGMTFLDRYGQIIATRGAKYGQPVTLAALPAYVPKAFLAAEDRRFYQHGPVDLRAIARAAEADLRAQRSVEGASTLTQQLARTLFLKREQSLKRKVQEAYLAWRLEQALSKDEILELYLNRTYFGDGAYGLDAASQTYFGIPASQLTLPEAALLAGLPNAPTRLALTNDMQGALARSHKILRAMRAEGWIDQSQFGAAMAAEPALAPPRAGEGDEGYVLDQAAEDATQLVGGDGTPDLVIRTTIDPRLQTAGSAILRQVVETEGARRRVSQGALVALAPDGAILAMVGGLDHDQSPFNRVTQAHRQPGSAFKAFVYGAAVEHGATAGEVRDDAPITYAGWSPQNYGHRYAGPVTLQEALARSLNTVAVRLTLELGPATVADFARRLGLSDIPPQPGPSIALGAYEVTPLELAAGYQVFQTGGGRTTPYLVSQIASTRGDVLYAHQASAPTPVMDPLYATRLVQMLKGVVTSGTGVGANIGRPAAGKTGTSQNWRDAWFVGFTPDVLAAVWVGNDDGAPMAKVTGGELPAEIWRKFMTVAEAGLPPRDFPWLVPDKAPPAAIPVSDTNSVSEDEPPDETGASPAGEVTPPADTEADAAGPPPPQGPAYGPGYGPDDGPNAQPGPPPDEDDPPPDWPPPHWRPSLPDEPPPGPPPRYRDDEGPDSAADGDARYRY